MLRTNSLVFRLAALSAIWSIFGLLAGFLILSRVFRNSAEHSFDTRLLTDFENIVAVTKLDCDGTFVMSRPLFTERFFNAFSGSYWQVSSSANPAAVLTSSRSLWDGPLKFPPTVPRGVVRTGYLAGPKKQQLRYAEQMVSIPISDEFEDNKNCKGGDRKFRIMVAVSTADMEADIERFNNTLFGSVAILGVGLIGIMLFQVRWGLRPLDQVSRSLAAIREGRADKLEGSFPAEIQPLADELNALVAHNEEVVARARTHVSNLAHFLKTPLSVIANEVQGQSGALADTVARQVQTMRRQVDHYLARARAVGSAKVIGARTEVAPVVPR